MMKEVKRGRGRKKEEEEEEAWNTYRCSMFGILLPSE